jgi:hypothetical protein
MRMKLFKKIISAALAVVLLTGCSSMSSGVKVGDEEFSATLIQETVDEILVARKTVDTSQMNLVNGPELLRNQAQFFVLRVLMDQIAKDTGIEVSLADIAERRSDVISRLASPAELPAALVSANLPASNLDPYLKVLIISERLQDNYVKSGGSESELPLYIDKLVVDTANKLGVTVNPKYGKWNPKNASIEPSDATDGAVVPLP